MGRKRIYTDEQLKEKQKEWNKKWLSKNTDYYGNYRNTPRGRANNLLNSYRREDKKRNRGECTLTAQWIIDNIFSQPCKHCGKTGWDKIGCNRLDNSKPHTPENVEPCCYECNIKLSKL